MPMDANEITEMKRMIDLSKKKSMNFGLCLASKPQDTVLYIDRIKPVDVLARRAKKAASGSKVAFGTISTSGKNMTFALYDDAPAGMELGTKQFLKAHGVSAVITLVSAKPDSAASGDASAWEAKKAALEPKVNDSLSLLPNGSKLRAVWGFAIQKAELEDYDAALAACVKLETGLTADVKAFAKDLLAKGMAHFDKNKAAMTADQRKDIRVEIEAFMKAIPTASAKELRNKMQDIVASTDQVVKQLKRDKTTYSKKYQDKIDELTRELTLLQAEFDSDPAAGVRGNLENLHKQYQANKNNGKQAQREKRKSRYEGAVERANKEIARKTAEHDARKLEITALMKVAEATKTAKEADQERAMKAIDLKLGTIRKSVEADPFASVKAQLEGTIKEMSDALEWQEQELARAGADNSHGTGRHGAQTGVDRQARRAATDGVAADSAGNEAGVTRHETTWNAVSIEWEEDPATGKRTIKSRTPVQKQVIAEVTRVVTSNRGSAFSTPVLEKKAVDTAISLMNSKGWNEICTSAPSNPSPNWRDLKSVAVVVEAPKALDIDGTSYTKSWGYQVGRKDAATMAVGDANVVLDKFEKGEITEDQMLNQLGVEKLLDGDALKKIPYATVVLTRGDGTSPWKSKTHYPNADATAAGWDIEGARVRKSGAAEETATF